jgi:GDPmannose 4,6-dehydratase
MAELDQPEDFILATGKKNTVEDLVRVTADVLQLNWQDVVRTRDGLVRQNVSDTPLVGDPSKAKKLLGWEAKTDLKQLVELMVRAELEGDLGVGFEKGK